MNKQRPTSSHSALIVKDHILHPTKGVQHTKKKQQKKNNNRHLDNMW